MDQGSHSAGNAPQAQQEFSNSCAIFVLVVSENWPELGLAELNKKKKQKKKKNQKHTTVRIRLWSPTILLTDRRVA
ncbi:hypothetical protein N7466_000172 [Penicillium verhagenii]|uniref:uncharacterized protein n=1 Tax=Penicillium verhagenii TaxID=1562060 RepID=UPI002545A6A1|nr:uncharacterized protein N7466_000172 [Penicillium verhagenii]KAJ5947157.1 hypothetical protein N7466_000172 [Penicillium verhagenii]